jgi:dihydrofolate synthase/folylpolyglutamate synthase
VKEEWWQGQSRFGIRPGLERIEALMERLSHPERTYPVIHIAGTNGKGSVAAMVTDALVAQGLRVGLNTSPDLGQINERVSINRVPLEESLWDRFGQEVEEAGRNLSDVPSFFEAITALALLAFARLRVDVAVVEVGLGGRLDATNIVPPPLLTIITPIAMDHTDRLGHTIEAIAGEKAGVLKFGSELVLARQSFPAARTRIVAEAAKWSVPVFEPEVEAWMTETGPALRIREGREVRVPLQGAYQTGNLETAWTAIERLALKGYVPRLDLAIEALKTVHWPGRFQVVSESPLIVVDGAHNLHGIDGVVATLAREPWNRKRWHLVFGALSDKPAEDMLDLIAPLVGDVVLTRVPGERGRDLSSLAPRLASDHWVKAVDDPVNAVEEALRRMQRPDEALLVAGSLSLLMYLNQRGLFQYMPGIRVDM